MFSDSYIINLRGILSIDIGETYDMDILFS